MLPLENCLSAEVLTWTTRLFKHGIRQLCWMGENMPLFVGVHKWKFEEQIAIIKESVAFFTDAPDGELPEGVQLCAAYSLTQGVYSVWNAPSKDALERTFGKYAPTTMKGTVFVPVMQTFLPTMGYTTSL